MPKCLLVFVSVVYNNNFSIKYIHLESHFFGKINNGVYNWPIGWKTFTFVSLVSLLVSHNVGSHTTQHTSYGDVLCLNKTLLVSLNIFHWQYYISCCQYHRNNNNNTRIEGLLSELRYAFQLKTRKNSQKVHCEVRSWGKET